MRRITLIAFTTLALAAMTVALASSAQAATAPFWSIGGVRLGADQTHNFDARQYTPFLLEVPELGVKIGCGFLTTEKGVLLGSAAGQPGKDDEIAVFSGCVTTGNGTPCNVEKRFIITKPLTSELVETVKGKQLLEEFKPTAGVELAKLKFEGAGCTTKETAVTGSVAAEALSEELGVIELEQPAKEATSWILNFPRAPIEKILLINTKGEDVVASVQLVAFGAVADLLGFALTLLANTKFEPEPNAKWSPLP